MHNFAIYEAVAHQVQQEDMQELRQRVEDLKDLGLKIEAMTPENICDLLDFETDSDDSMSIQNQLSSKMLIKVQNVREERRVEFTAKVRGKMGEKDKQLSQLLKFRVVDAVKPKMTALVSWWSPSEELLATVKQGQVVEIVNASAAPYKNEIQVTAGKSSSIKMKKPSSSEGFAKYFRTVTNISQIDRDFKPQQDEFDVACVVVRLELNNESEKVYVADGEMNILCINFWPTLSANAYDDVVVVGQVLYAANLQWRSSHASDQILQSFVHADTTSFIVNPKKEEHRSRLEELICSVESLDEFVIKCNDKIEELKSGNLSLNKENHRKNVSIELSSVKSSPLVLRSGLNKNFLKTPIGSAVNATPPVKRRLGMFSSSSFSNQACSPKVPQKRVKYDRSLRKPNFKY